MDGCQPLALVQAFILDVRMGNQAVREIVRLGSALISNRSRGTFSSAIGSVTLVRLDPDERPSSMDRLALKSAARSHRNLELQDRRVRIFPFGCFDRHLC